MKVEQWLADMRETLAEYRNEHNANAISKYFRNQFASFGLKMANVSNLTKLFLAEAKHFLSKNSAMQSGLCGTTGTRISACRNGINRQIP
ncbi:MAG: DNA alkylation repair protein [Saprospiraceae bacterium]|nr:DNA alkylation repair protein [Candidatus Brachybacter algidus]